MMMMELEIEEAIAVRELIENEEFLEQAGRIAEEPKCDHGLKLIQRCLNCILDWNLRQFQKAFYPDSDAGSLA